MTKVESYWRQVAAVLAADGIAKASGSPLDWETLQISAESRGFLRKNITNPINMARNGLNAAFYPANF